LVNSQTNFDDVSIYLKFGHKSITLSKKFTLIVKSIKLILSYYSKPFSADVGSIQKENAQIVLREILKMRNILLSTVPYMQVKVSIEIVFGSQLTRTDDNVINIF
jgi:hypothetical protein